MDAGHESISAISFYFYFLPICSSSQAVILLCRILNFEFAHAPVTIQCHGDSMKFSPSVTELYHESTINQLKYRQEIKEQLFVCGISTNLVHFGRNHVNWLLVAIVREWDTQVRRIWRGRYIYTCGSPPFKSLSHLLKRILCVINSVLCVSEFRYADRVHRHIESAHSDIIVDRHFNGLEALDWVHWEGKRGAHILVFATI